MPRDALSGVDLSVLVVTYQSRAFVDACLESVRATVREHTVEVIVVDNASADGSAEHVRAGWPDVQVVQMGRNAGFSAANNVGYAAARGRHVLLLNGDATVGTGALDGLVRFLDERPEAGVVAPKLLNLDGSDQGTARRFPTPAAAVFGRRSPVTRLLPHNPVSRRYLSGLQHEGDQPFEVDWVSGACLMVRRAAVDVVGLLDDGFFMHWEDADWCRRFKDAGWSVWVLPSVSAVHAEGGSRQGWPAAQVRHFHDGAYRYYAKHHLTGGRAVLRPAARGLLALRSAAVTARSGGRPTPSAGPADLAVPALATRGKT